MGDQEQAERRVASFSSFFSMDGRKRRSLFSPAPQQKKRKMANGRDEREEEHDIVAKNEADNEEQKKEEAYDSALPESMRKLRPKGFPFNLPPTDRPVRIYADGVFDLFHLGHMRQLEQAKKALDNVELVVGIPSDKVTHKLKGLTVLNDRQRAESLRHCRWVDEVIEDAPWEVTEEFLAKHKIDYVAHDDLPYVSSTSEDIYRPMKVQGKFLVTQRTEGVSTSDIITIIIRDYDKYLMRNFARGISRQDLNVSWLKKNEIDLKRHVMNFRESLKPRIDFHTMDIYAEFMGLLRSFNTHRETVDGKRAIKDEEDECEDEEKKDPRYTGNSVMGHFREWLIKTIEHVDQRLSMPSSPESEEEVKADEDSKEDEDEVKDEEDSKEDEDEVKDEEESKGEDGGAQDSDEARSK